MKCMTTEPGCLPKCYDSILFKKLAPEMQYTLKQMQVLVHGFKPDDGDNDPQPPKIDYRLPEKDVNSLIEAHKKWLDRSKKRVHDKTRNRQM